jgi:hypothetical protein
MNDQLIIPARYAEIIPVYVINALMNGLQVNPEDRTKDVEALREELSATPGNVVSSFSGVNVPKREERPKPPVQPHIVHPAMRQDPLFFNCNEEVDTVIKNGRRNLDDSLGYNDAASPNKVPVPVAAANKAPYELTEQQKVLFEGLKEIFHCQHKFKIQLSSILYGRACINRSLYI